MALTKSELIERIADRQAQLSPKDVELAVKTLIEQMAEQQGLHLEELSLSEMEQLWLKAKKESHDDEK